MSIDKSRARKFRNHIDELQAGLGFDIHYDVIRSKLLDRIAKAELEGDTLRSFMRQVKRYFDPEYSKYIDRIYSRYNEIIESANMFYSDIGYDLNRDMGKIQAIEKVNLKRLGDYEESAVRNISKVVRRGIMEGKPHTEIGKDLDKLGGKVSSYADTLARTQVKGYSRAMKMEKARIGEVFYHQYIGIIRVNTRYFCRYLLNQGDPTFHIRDIRQMRNGQLEPVETYNGGYNCHHDFEPDPFFKDGNYSANIITLSDGSRTLRIAKRT